MGPDGSSVTRLTHDSAIDSSAAWSPDGKKIAYVSIDDNGWHIYSMNTDGSNVTRLTQGESFNSRPAWTPDGRRIVFEREGNIYIMNADGSDVTNLTRHPSWETSSLCFCSVK
jgi:TolB protein